MPSRAVAAPLVVHPAAHKALVCVPRSVVARRRGGGDIMRPSSALLFVAALHAHGGKAAETAASGGGVSLLRNPLDLDSNSLALLEFALVVLVSVYCVTFYIGARRNLSRAHAFADALDGALRGQFHKVGHAGGDAKRLIRDGACQYWYHASGRVRMPSLTAHICLSPRQDFFAILRQLFSAAPPERVIFYAPLDTLPAPMSVLLIRARELSRWRNHGDGDALRAARSLAGDVLDGDAAPAPLGAPFATLAEHRDLVSALLSSSVRQALRPLVPHLQSLHVSDVSMKWDPTCSLWAPLLRIEFTLPEDDTRSRVLTAAAILTCTIADSLPTVRISSAARKKATDLRRKLRADEAREDMRRRREENAERKEKVRKEREVAVAKMSREKQLKHDEKMRKKAVRERMKKVVRK